MKNCLIVVDMQKDFVDGALGSAEAQAIVDAACERIKRFDGPVFVTLDTHFGDYMDTREGAFLPVPHCVKGTPGHALNDSVAQALAGKDVTTVEKLTFGSVELPGLIAKKLGGAPDSVTLLGLCTDICVVSNALIVKAHFPEADVCVAADSCAGVTPEKHAAALDTMASCQIRIL